MKNFIDKTDNAEGAEGVVTAEEYNSLFRENKNVVSNFLELSDSDSSQMAKAVNAFGKSMYYEDVGTVNTVLLKRANLSSSLDMLFDGMVFMFNVKHENTGTVTLKVSDTTTRVAVDENGDEFVGGELKPKDTLIAVYRSSKFYISKMMTSKKEVVTMSDDNVVIEPKYTNGAQRTQDQKNSDMISIGEFADATKAYQYAKNNNVKVFVPNGDFTVTGTDLDLTVFYGIGIVNGFPVNFGSEVSNEQGQSEDVAISQKGFTDYVSEPTNAASRVVGTEESNVVERDANGYPKNNNALGVGQTWQDVISSRALDTMYTNTTGRPIAIYINVQDTYPAGLALWINGVKWFNSGDFSVGAHAPISMIIPHGSTYKVTTGYTGTLYLYCWRELR